jgi:hypothetical protein
MLSERHGTDHDDHRNDDVGERDGQLQQQGPGRDGRPVSGR